MKRGDIYYIYPAQNYGEIGSEQRSGRPGVIVSNDKCNQYSDVLEVVYLTTKNKTDLPTHIDIRSAPQKSIALCEQINSVSVNRFGDYLATCSDYEMAMIDAALAISLGINPTESMEFSKNENTDRSNDFSENEQKSDETVIRLTAENRILRQLYDELLAKFSLQTRS